MKTPHKGLGWTIPITNDETLCGARAVSDGEGLLDEATRLFQELASKDADQTDDDGDRREAWYIRAGVEAPAWCKNDPRLDACAAVLLAVLDSVADDDAVVMTTPAVLARLMRLLPSEVAMRFDAAIERLVDVGLVEHAVSGYLLFRDTGLPQEDEPAEWMVEELHAWARSLPDGGAAVRQTLLGNGTPTPEAAPRPSLHLVKGGRS